MKASQFIRVKGVDEARKVLSKRGLRHKSYTPNVGAYHVPEITGPIKLSMLQRLVESVDLVNKFGGLEAAKSKVKMALFNGFLLISFPVDSGIGSIYTHKVELVIKDYESIYGEGNETN